MPHEDDQPDTNLPALIHKASSIADTANFSNKIVLVVGLTLIAVGIAATITNQFGEPIWYDLGWVALHGPLSFGFVAAGVLLSCVALWRRPKVIIFASMNGNEISVSASNGVKSHVIPEGQPTRPGDTQDGDTAKRKTVLVALLSAEDPRQSVASLNNATNAEGPLLRDSRRRSARR